MRKTPMVMVWSTLALAMVIGLLALSGSWVQAQGDPTPTLDAPPGSPLGSLLEAAAEASYEALAETAAQENVEWGNITFWAGGTLGMIDASSYAINFAVGEALPAFTMPLLDGQQYDLAASEGPLLVNFWASWCAPCRQETPLLLAAHEAAETPYEIVLVNVWDTPQEYETYATEEFPVTLTSGRAEDVVPDMVGVRAIPTSVLLDANHAILAVHVGNLTAGVMDFLAALSGGPDGATVVEAPPVDAAAGDPPAGDLETMAMEVARANESTQSGTLWAGGMAGSDDGFRLNVAVGDKLPAFGLTTLDGEPFRLDVYGEPLLINFWASWCGPCIEEFPLLIAQDQTPDSPYRVAFVNVWDDPYTYQQFMADYPDDLLVMTDPAGAVTDDYGVLFIPTSVLVDAGGTVQMVQLGMFNEEALAFAAMLVAGE